MSLHASAYPVKVGIVGGAGYAAGELLRILLHHPGVTIVSVQSQSHADRPLSDVHADLAPYRGMRFEATLSDDVDCVFLCCGHHQSRKTLAEHPALWSKRIIDLSQDYRLKDASHNFIYGLPEVHRQDIERAFYVANPGCFATGILLALLPLAEAGRLREVHVTAITGSTGAGHGLADTAHFSWRSGNVSVYKAFGHQHLAEIRESLTSLQSDWEKPLNFVPMRGPFTRGILVSTHLDFDGTLDEAKALYHDFYEAHPFTHVVDREPDLKQVLGTNHCFLSVAKHDGKLHIVSVIDNLIKGASGQAVHNMNLMYGLPEDVGLRLKATAF